MDRQVESNARPTSRGRLTLNAVCGHGSTLSVLNAGALAEAEALIAPMKRIEVKISGFRTNFALDASGVGIVGFVRPRLVGIWNGLSQRGSERDDTHVGRAYW
jgi:hypothetical protein